MRSHADVHRASAGSHRGVAEPVPAVWPGHGAGRPGRRVRAMRRRRLRRPDGADPGSSGRTPQAGGRAGWPGRHVALGGAARAVRRTGQPGRGRHSAGAARAHRAAGPGVTEAEGCQSDRLLPSLSDAMERNLEQPERVDDDGPNQARSIGDRLATTMSLLTVRRGQGDAVSCDDDQLWAAWQVLAENGIVLELSSAAALHGARHLAESGALSDYATVVLLGTAGPYAQATLRPPGDEPRPSLHRRVADPGDPTEVSALTTKEST
ncbi:MAG TPA: pyridoxal-phosphate dependent enzyme [Actinomycetes bacterium]|nr:pyridoxal-phosphate dependent enzyme [Actinomycetes bacterium]